MPHTRSSLAAFVLAAFSYLTLQAQQPDAPPVDPDATPQAHALLHEIDTISGHGTLSGQHNFPNVVSRYSDRVFELTGAYPAVFGQDFGFSGGEDKDSTLGRPSMIEEIIRQYHRGAIIALTWHAVPPTEDEPVTFRDDILSHLTDAEWQELITPGTNLHARWERQVDVIAGYLRELQDAGVPVLFRPYHEMNGNWFWWGGRPGPKGSQELYRQIFNRYVHVHGLHNLVWVWNVQTPSSKAGPVDQYFPGPAFADVETLDVYGPFDQTSYESMTALAGQHKPIAFGEVGTMPTLATLAQQPRWAYMMIWSGWAESANTPEQLQTMFHAPSIINRGDARLPAPPPIQANKPSPADPKATAATHELLQRLATIIKTTPAGTSASIQPTFANLKVNDRSTDDLRRDLQRITAAGQVPLIRWTPPSPAGGGQHALDDFEFSELRKSGTRLANAWTEQIRQLTTQLNAVHSSATALVLDPLPEPDGTSFWWDQRPGPEGTAALRRDLRAALASAGIHFVLLAAEPAMTAAAPGSRPAHLATFFSGPLDYDLILSKPEGANQDSEARDALHDLAGPKPLLPYTPPS